MDTERRIRRETDSRRADSETDKDRKRPKEDIKRLGDRET